MNTLPIQRATSFGLITLFVAPMLVMILGYSAFMLRPPLIEVSNPYLRWIVGYTELYGRYQHAVMSWRLVFIGGFLLTVTAILLEHWIGRRQNGYSMVFHIALAFCIGFASFYLYRRFAFDRIIVIPRPEYLQRYTQYEFRIILSSLKTAMAYATISVIMSSAIIWIRSIREKSTQPETRAYP